MSLIPLRPAGPNEHRCIIRQAVDFYRHLVVGGVYTTSKAVDLEACLVKALKLCVSKHPILSAVITGSEGEKPQFAKPSHLDLKNHYSISSPRSSSNASGSSDPASPSAGSDWREQSRSFLLKTLDTPFPDVSTIPPWRVFAVPLPPDPASSTRRYLMLLGYGHSHGDGIGGLAFNRTLLQGLDLSLQPDCPYDADPRCPTTSAALLPAVEKAAKLSVSASYLLSPLLSQYLPKFVAGPLGVRASAVPEAPGSWSGEPTVFYPGADKLASGAEVLRTPDSVVQKVLAACRRRDGRMTGLLHMLVVRALSEVLPEHENTQSFVSQSAVDLRRAIPSIGKDDMAVCVTGYYEAFPRATSTSALWRDWTAGDANHAVWARIRDTTAGLERQASTLHNQPIGLLKFLSDFRGWMLGHVGKKRDASYEMSNLTQFDPYLGLAPDERAKKLQAAPWRLESAIFAQPANVPGGCFETNVVTLKGADMTTVFTWQRGALGVDDEDRFMSQIAGKVGAGLQELADAEKNRK